MARLNIERQKELEPKRMEYAKSQIEKLGYEIEFEDNVELKFRSTTGNLISFFPYSGWYSGKGIGSGRGIDNLLNLIQ